MINISKFLAVGSLLLNGISASSSDWDKYDTGLAFGNFYDFQKDYVLCKGDYKCMDSKDEYLNLFHDDCQICFPKGVDEIYDNGGCYSKQEYDGWVAQGIEAIIKWDHTITDINPTPESEYGEYGEYGYDSSTVYTVTVEVDREYTRDQCEYRTYETEEFKIDSGKISSYEVINIPIKDKKCGEQYYTMTKPPTSWEKSTESPTTPNIVPPIPTSKPTWAPVTARPTTPAPVTPAPVPVGGFKVPTQSPNPGGILTLPTESPSTTVNPTPPLNTPLIVPTQSPSPQISTTWTTSTPMKCNCDGDKDRSGSWGGRRGLRGGKKNKKGGKNKGGSWGKGKGGKKHKGGSWSNSYDDDDEDEEECDYGYKCVKENRYNECGICIRDYGESRY